MHCDNSFANEYDDVIINVPDAAYADGKFGKSLYSSTATSAGPFRVIASNIDAIKPHLNGDWTFDYWTKTYINLGSTGMAIGSEGTNISTAYIILSAARTGTLMAIQSVINPDGNGITLYYNVIANYDAFSHVALVKKGDSYYTFINGTLVNETVNNTAYIIRPANNNFLFLTDYIDEVRFTPYAAWTENFTPPSAPYEK